MNLPEEETGATSNLSTSGSGPAIGLVRVNAASRTTAAAAVIRKDAITSTAMRLGRQILVATALLGPACPNDGNDDEATPGSTDTTGSASTAEDDPDDTTAAATSAATTSETTDAIDPTTTTADPTAADSTDDTSDDPTTGDPATCPAGSKPGAAGSTDAMPTAAGVSINVRTPADYDPTVAYPLVVVYAPAGGDADLTEAFTGLTNNALDGGYVIAYADHVSPMSLEIIEGLQPILDDIVDTWCIDTERVFFTGHSDGGTMAEILLARDETDPQPRAAAPSNAGVTGMLLSQVGCPSVPKAVMVIHSANDGLFPPANGFGLDAAEVWAGCNGCDPQPVDDGPCIRWPNCDDDVPTLFCETAGQHGQWTNLNATMFEFFTESSP